MFVVYFEEATQAELLIGNTASGLDQPTNNL